MTTALGSVTDRLVADLGSLEFGAPVAYVYNPLVYARGPWDEYLRRFGAGPVEAVLVGMNPGPWGMAQTGVPFGAVDFVRSWMGIEAAVGQPLRTHPRRPVTGFACRRAEVSGSRLWGWARDRFGTPERFFGRFYVANYCPLLFLDDAGVNLTPDKLPMAARQPLNAACDTALRATVRALSPRIVIGIGAFAEARSREALAGQPVAIGRISHPSPASPAANRGWAALIENELAALGVTLQGGA